MNNLFTTRRLRRISGFAALLAITPLAVSLSARAQDAKETVKDAVKDTPPAMWTLKPAKGDTYKQRVRIELTGSIAGMDLNIVGTGVDAFEVKDVKDDEITIFEKTESSKTMVNDMEQPSPAQTATYTRVYSKTGVLKKVTIDGVSEEPDELKNLSKILSNFPAPEKPVKAGDTWKTDIDNALVDGKKVTFTSTYVGMEKVAGIDTFKVKLTANILPKADAKDDDAIKVTETYNVDPKTGRNVRITQNLDNFTVSAQGNTLTLKGVFKTNLIVPGVNDKDDADTKKTDK